MTKCVLLADVGPPPIYPPQPVLRSVIARGPRPYLLHPEWGPTHLEPHAEGNLTDIKERGETQDGRGGKVKADKAGSMIWAECSGGGSAAQRGSCVVCIWVLLCISRTGPLDSNVSSPLFISTSPLSCNLAFSPHSLLSTSFAIGRASALRFSQRFLPLFPDTRSEFLRIYPEAKAESLTLS